MKEREIITFADSGGKTCRSSLFCHRLSLSPPIRFCFFATIGAFIGFPLKG
jgi:hypothetical protein